MKIETNAFCPECGPDVRTDEEGCCSTCGATATGTAVVALARRLATLESRLAEVERERDEARAQRDGWHQKACEQADRATAAEARVKVLAASATDETEARHALRARLARIEAAAREAADLLGVVASEVKGDAASVYGQVRWARDARRVEASIRTALEGGRW